MSLVTAWPVVVMSSDGSGVLNLTTNSATSDDYPTWRAQRGKEPRHSIHVG